MPNSKNNTYAFSDIMPIHGYPDDMWHSMVPKGFADGLYECYVEWTDDGSLPIVDWEDPASGEEEYWDYEIIAQSGAGDFTLTGGDSGYDDRRDLHGPLTQKGMFGISGRPYPYWIDSTIFDKQVGGRRDYKFKLGGGSFTYTGKPIGFNSLIRGLLLDAASAQFLLRMTGQVEGTKDLSLSNTQLGKFYTSGREHGYGHDHNIFDKHIGSIRDYRFKVGSASFDVEGQRLNVSLNKSPVAPAHYDLTVNEVGYTRINKPFYRLCGKTGVFELAGKHLFQGDFVDEETLWYDTDDYLDAVEWLEEDNTTSTIWVDKVEATRRVILHTEPASFVVDTLTIADQYRCSTGHFNITLQGVGSYNASWLHEELRGDYRVNDATNLRLTRWDVRKTNGPYAHCEPTRDVVETETVYDPVPPPITGWDKHRLVPGGEVGFKLVRADGTEEIELSKTVVKAHFVINGGEVGFYGYKANNTRWDKLVNPEETIWSPDDKEWNTEWDVKGYYGDKLPPMPHC